MEDEKIELSPELERTMTEIQNKMTGELWQDIQIILMQEQEVIFDFDCQLIEYIDEIENEIGEKLQTVLELAKPETEDEFWEQLTSLRMEMAATDNAIGELRQITTNVRIWFRSYICGFLEGLGDQIDSLK